MGSTGASEGEILFMNLARCLMRELQPACIRPFRSVSPSKLRGNDHLYEVAERKQSYPNPLLEATALSSIISS